MESIALLLFFIACLTNKETGLDSPESTCVVPQDKFPLLADVPATQIHADLASNGETIWMVYNVPNADSQFDVYLTSFSCDGTRIQDPTQVLAIEGLNQTTPRIAVANNRVLVASQGDNGGNPNLSIHLHIQQFDGTIVSESKWEPAISTGNMWLPSVVGTESGFWIAAAVANEGHFQTAVQALDLDGEPRSEAKWVGPESYAVFPNIDANADQFIVGWETGEDSVQYTLGSLDSEEEQIETIQNQAGVRVLFDSSQVFTHQKSPLQLMLDGSSISQSTNTFYANASTGDDYTLFTYFRLQNGYENDILYGYIGQDGSLTKDILLSNDPPAAPYRPAVTHIRENIYFIAWSQGNNPDFEIWGQFIHLDM
jgi:hypothetical protein